MSDAEARVNELRQAFSGLLNATSCVASHEHADALDALATVSERVERVKHEIESEIETEVANNHE